MKIPILPDEEKCINCYYVGIDNMYEPESEFLCFKDVLKNVQKYPKVVKPDFYCNEFVSMEDDE